MNRDPPTCAPYTSSSDSNVGSDGGNREGGNTGICGFRILDVQNLHDGGDGTDLEPGEPGPLAGFSHGGVPRISNSIRVKEEPNEDFHSRGLGGSIVVVKVEPEPTDHSLSQDFNVEVEVKSECVDDCSFQDQPNIGHCFGEMSPLEAGCLPATTSSTSQGTLDDTLVIREPCQTSLSADEGQEKDVENWLSSYNNAVLKCNTRSKGNSQNSCDENKSNHCPVQKSQYKCHVYKKVFPHHSQLTAHKMVHPDVKHYKCPVCEKDFAHSSQLDMHKIVHAGKKPKQYKCSVCQKAFLRSTYLKTHQKIHSEENTFRCSICDQIFSTSSHLQKHKVTHAGGNICDVSVCKKAFSSSSYLKEDEVDHTGEKTSNCSYCKKSSDVIWLNGDDTIPIDEKTFNCSVCKSPFSSSSSLQMDRKECPGAKTFRCYVCKMVFSSCFYLSNHKNSHEQKYF